MGGANDEGIENIDVSFHRDKDGNALQDGSVAASTISYLDDDEEEVMTLAQNCSQGWNWTHVYYLSLLSVVGVTFRAYLGRFFGGDCSHKGATRARFKPARSWLLRCIFLTLRCRPPGDPIEDWLWPLSHKICVTTNGKTEQYGGAFAPCDLSLLLVCLTSLPGALFIDLPANVFGSFILGLVTGHSVEWPAMPCFHQDHPVQRQTGLHVGLRTALCGSLTTFSSWNTQMVLMMDGTSNPYLNSQVLAALVGYMIGMQAAVASFRAGRAVAAWIHVRRNPHLFDSELSKLSMEQRKIHSHAFWITPFITTLFTLSLVGLYMLGDFYWGILWYRQMWIGCLVAPFGTILRWRLSRLNCKLAKLPWFPLGTFLANFIGSILSAGISASDYLEPSDEEWTVSVIDAISLGVAGSLSTVSTFVKEIAEITEKNHTYDKKAFIYAVSTLISCCFVGLAVYSPIVRYG